MLPVCWPLHASSVVHEQNVEKWKDSIVANRGLLTFNKGLGKSSGADTITSVLAEAIHLLMSKRITQGCEGQILFSRNELRRIHLKVTKQRASPSSTGEYNFMRYARTVKQTE